MNLHTLVALLALFALPVTAETMFTVKSPGLTVDIPLPAFVAERGAKDWASAGVGPNGGPTLIQELIPGDESFDGWTTLFAVLIEEDLDMTLPDYTELLTGIYDEACTPAPEIFAAEIDDTRTELVITCPAYTDAPGTGEVALFTLRRDGNDFARAYQHWRLPALEHGSALPDALLPRMDHFLAISAEMRITQNN